MNSVLTAEIATQFLEDESCVRLNSFELLADDAAVILANHRVSDDPLFCALDLSGLRTLSEESARALSVYEGPMLDLSGLRELSLPLAKTLATFRGLLDLDGLSEISPSVAEALSTHRGNLYLRGLKSLDKETAKALAKHEDLTISIQNFSPEIGNLLASSRRLELILPHNPEVAGNQIYLSVGIRGDKGKSTEIKLDGSAFSKYLEFSKSLCQFLQEIGMKSPECLLLEMKGDQSTH